MLTPLLIKIVRLAEADARSKLFPNSLLPLLERLPGELSAKDGGEAISLYALLIKIGRLAESDARAKLFPDSLLPLEVVLERLPGELSALEGGEAISLYAKVYAREYQRAHPTHPPFCGCQKCDPEPINCG